MCEAPTIPMEVDTQLSQPDSEEWEWVDDESKTKGGHQEASPQAMRAHGDARCIHKEDAIELTTTSRRPASNQTASMAHPPAQATQQSGCIEPSLQEVQQLRWQQHQQQEDDDLRKTVLRQFHDCNLKAIQEMYKKIIHQHFEHSWMEKLQRLWDECQHMSYHQQNQHLKVHMREKEQAAQQLQAECNEVCLTLEKELQQQPTMEQRRQWLEQKREKVTAALARQQQWQQQLWQWELGMQQPRTHQPHVQQPQQWHQQQQMHQPDQLVLQKDASRQVAEAQTGQHRAVTMTSAEPPPPANHPWVAQAAAAEAEEARRKAKEEEARRAAEAVELRRQAEAAKRQAEEEEARRKSKEEEARRKSAEEAEARMRAEEEARRRKAEEEEKAIRRAEEQAEARRKAEEEAEVRRKVEEEARRKKAEEEEARRKKAEEEEARRKKAEEEAQRRKAEEEAWRKRAEEEARRRAEEEARRRAEEEQRRRAEEEARRRAEEEQRRRALRWHVSPTSCGKFTPPYRQGLRFDILAFYNPGHRAPCDEVCKCEFLGNFFDHRENNLVLEFPHGSQVIHYRTAEAAFQSTKYKERAYSFANLSGDGALWESKKLRKENRGDVSNYGGFGSNWQAMSAVLKAKFTSCPEATAALGQTGDAFLLEHNSEYDRDRIWSNNADGEGTNWLGMQLMLLRDELFAKDDWTTWLERNINMATGEPRPGSVWQDCVRKATEEVEKHPRCKAPECKRRKCCKPTFNRKQGYYCRYHHVEAPRCKTSHCNEPTWNDQPGQYCTLECKQRDEHRLAQEEKARRCPTPLCAGSAWNEIPGYRCWECHQAPKCKVVSCLTPSWNRQEGQLCQTHFDKAPKCKRDGCNWPSYEEKEGAYCSKKCKEQDESEGSSSSWPALSDYLPECMGGSKSNGPPRKPTTAGASSAASSGQLPDIEHGNGQSCSAAKTPLCKRDGCYRPTWNGQPGEYCGKTCRKEDRSEAKQAPTFPEGHRKGCQCWKRMP